MSLKERLQKLSATKPKDEINWEEKKQYWIKNVDSIFSEIEKWFEEYLTAGYMKLAKGEKPITEEEVGTYNVPMLAFVFAENRLIFEPMGMNVIGAKGRIDVYIRGRKVDKYFLLLEEKENHDLEWTLIYSNNIKVKMIFSKENLEKVLEQWIDNYSI